MFFSSFSIASIGCVRVPTATPFSQRLLRAKLRHRPKETAVGKCWLRCHSVSDFSIHGEWSESQFQQYSNICAHGRTCKLYQSWRLIKFSLFSASESVLPVSSHWGKALSENIALNICTHCELMTSFCHSSACHLLKVAEGLALWPRSVVWGQAAYRYRPPTCRHISERLMKTHNFDSW